MRRPGLRIGALLGAVFCIAGASDPADRLRDTHLEARARALFTETRCLVCQGQSIDDSDADLAGDLRRIIRDQVATGRSDAEIRDFLRARYGDFVLLRPRFTAANAALWGAPFLIVGIGTILLVSRRRRPADAPPLTAAEEAALAKLTEDSPA